MKRTIRKVAVLGSGIMGSRIACHFANAGFKVLLLDIVPKEYMGRKKGSDPSPDTSLFRNSLVNASLDSAVRSKPAPLYTLSDLQKITTGNFEDDMDKIKNCDWVIEVVVERLDIKQKIFEQVEKYRKPGTLVTTNTSGIPVNMITEGRSEDFRKHFCGTHFFNPPRYLRLLEIIPAKETLPEVTEFLLDFGDRYLGKTTITCKDTPAFIANRIGVYSIMSLLHTVSDMELTVEEVDKLTGPVLGRPKSATFRTTDVVGLDTMIHVANGLYEHCTTDTVRDKFKLPEFVRKMAENKWYGDKTGQGFYKKVKDGSGKSEILALDLKTLEYHPKKKVGFETLESTKQIDGIEERTKILFNGKDKAGEFYRTMFTDLFSYITNRIPEITDDIYKVDMAMKAGFGWELGPFEIWDAIGMNDVLATMEKAGKSPASWVSEMVKKGHDRFYKLVNATPHYYDTLHNKYSAVPGTAKKIVLKDHKPEKVVWKNKGCSLIDIGDDVLNLEFHTKMNTIGGEILQGIHKGIDLATQDFRGLVIGNDSENFSAGANLALVFMFAIEQEWDEIDFAVRAFQKANMRIRYSPVPVVLASHGLTLGGGCEMSLHADKVQAAAETYTGLVEFGVGLIPGGGGTKEFTKRFSDSLEPGDIELNALRNRFLTIAQAKVSTSATEAFELGILRNGHDEITMNRSRLLSDAKSSVIVMSEEGYTQPIEEQNIRVLGRSALGMIYAGTNSMLAGNYISEHDQLISRKLGWVMCGGDLSSPTTVSEQYLLDLEREAFLSLCGERKTLERIKSILTTGKPLRN
jgi:3-hydroxyacyl-CoA dehydrogenase